MIFLLKPLDVTYLVLKSQVNFKLPTIFSFYFGKTCPVIAHNSPFREEEVCLSLPLSAEGIVTITTLREE